MLKKLIKVIKRNKKDIAVESQVVAVAPKIETGVQPGLINTVNMWIYERSENRRREKAFSQDKISEWKILL